MRLAREWTKYVFRMSNKHRSSMSLSPLSMNKSMTLCRRSLRRNLSSFRMTFRTSTYTRCQKYCRWKLTLMTLTSWTNKRRTRQKWTVWMIRFEIWITKSSWLLSYSMRVSKCTFRKESMSLTTQEKPRRFTCWGKCRHWQSGVQNLVKFWKTLYGKAHQGLVAAKSSLEAILGVVSLKIL